MANAALCVARQQRNLVEPQLPFAWKQNGKFCERVGFGGPEREGILLPIPSNLWEHRARVFFPVCLIRLQRDDNLSYIVCTLQPNISFIVDSCPNRNPTLMNASPLFEFALHIHTKRVLAGQRILIPIDRKINVSIPSQAQSGIIVSVIRITLPVSRQSEGIRLLVEAAIAHQFRIEPAFNILEHELGELPI